MAKFADLAPAVGVVRARGHDFEVHGLTLASIAALVARFRGLAAVLDGGDPVQSILAQGDDAVSAVIAAATGEPEAEIRSAQLRAHEQAAFLVGVLQLTLPEQEDELGNLLAAVGQLSERVAAAGSGSESGKSSQPAGTGPAS